MVFMFNFSDSLKPKSKKKPIIKPVEDKLNTSSNTTTEQAEVSYINNTNSTNNIKSLNEEEHTQNSQFENQEELSKQKKLRQKNKSNVEPKEEEVIKYFQEQNFPVIEANKFYNYFSSNGWLVGGKTPMKNWKASAKNWMLNSEKYRFNNSKCSIQPQNLSSSTDKNYSEPL